MPRRKRRVTLFHNQLAGDADHATAELVALIETAGYAVLYCDARNCDIPRALEQSCDLVAVAGGDGTVRKVALAGRPDGPPIAILPVGTANNIANSLGISAALQHLIAGWRNPTLCKFHPIEIEAPWGRQRLIEGFGLGAFAQAIDEGEGDDKPLPLEARRQIAAQLQLAEPQELDIRVDEARITGDFLLVEVTTIPLVGPNLYLAPDADPADRLIDLCLVTADERSDVTAWLENPTCGAAAPLVRRSAGHIAISGHFDRTRIDDAVRTSDRAEFGTITLASAGDPLHFVVPS